MLINPNRSKFLGLILLVLCKKTTVDVISFLIRLVLLRCITDVNECVLCLSFFFSCIGLLDYLNFFLLICPMLCKKTPSSFFFNLSVYANSLSKVRSE